MTPRNDYSIDVGLAPDEIIVDSFAGGGGASLGISWALGRAPHIAINHDKEAIALHRANHPESEHFAEDVWHVDPVKACRGRRVGLMWLSPDCKHFSKAKGGKPVSKKLRGLAWTACRWAKAVAPRVIFLENVEEFEDWGPLYAANHRIKKLRNRPIPAKKGITFAAFVARLRRLGYEVNWCTFKACDYGAPTIRNRFFLIARRDGGPIVWPMPTHGKGRPEPWHTAAECIDWSIECPSIFERVAKGKKPLAENTMRRIARGVQKFVIDSPSPFIVGVGGRMGQSPERGVEQPYHTITSKADSAIVVPHITKFRNGATGSPMDEPMPTVTANSFIKRPGGAAPLGVVAPYLARVSNGERDKNGKKRGKGENDLTEPLPTQMTTNSFGLIAPHLIPTAHQGDERAHSIEEPMRTITGAHRGEHALIAPFLKPRYGEDPNPARRGGQGQAPRVRSLEEPMPVVVPTGNGGDIVATFLAKHNGGHEATGQILEEPVHTVTATDQKALVTAHIKRDFGQSIGSDAQTPLGTITPGGQGKSSLVTSHLAKLYGTCQHGQQLELPMPTVTASGRGGGHIAEVRAFLIAYYGTQQQTGNLNDPAPTLTAKDRFGLVTVAGVDYVIADIGMRMLQPRELYRAQGFPDSYLIAVPFDYVIKRKRKGRTRKVIVRKPLTKTAQVRMCGNSVPPHMAAALVCANLLGATFASARASEAVA